MADQGPDITIIALPYPAAQRAERLSYDSVANYLSAAGLKVHRLQPVAPPEMPLSFFSRAVHRRKNFIFLFRQLLMLRNTSALLYIPFPYYFLLSVIARLFGFALIYHLQEEQQSSRRQWLLWIGLRRLLARHVVYHSRAGKSCYPPGSAGYTVLGPILERRALSRMESSENSKRAFPFTLLMVMEQASPAALERYISLTRSLPSMQFLLLANTEISLPPDTPSNLQYSSRPGSRKSFFQQAHLLLQLDDQAQGYSCTDATFLEGLSYGLPVIALRKAGQQGLIRQQSNGYTFTSEQLVQLRQQILELSINRDAYFQLSAGAQQTAREQTAEAVISRVIADLGLHTPAFKPSIKPTAG